MITLEHFLPVEANRRFFWQRFLLDSLLAIAGALMITWMIYLFQLYPRIPNISIVYRWLPTLRNTADHPVMS